MKSEFATPASANLAMSEVASPASAEMEIATIFADVENPQASPSPSLTKRIRTVLSGKKSVLEMDKVQKLVSGLIRSRPMFIANKRIRGKTLLNVGCGPEVAPEFINLDYFWHPRLDVCWDITRKPYPFADNSLEGIFTEHCLEHITYEDGLKNMQEFYRMLKPGGVARIVVPDAEIYLDLYQRKKAGHTVTMPYGEHEPTAVYSINRIFRDHWHQFIYDYETMRLLLQQAGFETIRKVSFREGSNPQLLVEHEERRIESLYVEAIK